MSIDIPDILEPEPVSISKNYKIASGFTMNRDALMISRKTREQNNFFPIK
jgi:hypothetical protein